MRLRKLFVPVRGDSKGENVLDHAVTLAKPVNAHVETVYCHATTEDLMPYGVVVPSFLRDQITEASGNIASAEETRMRELFDKYAADHGVSIVDGVKTNAKEVTLSWQAERGKMASVVSDRGRLADIVVVAKPDRERNLGRNTLESALMETGRPVLMCPPTKADTIGQHVVVAWNGSTEATRAIAMTMPLLAKAEKITVVIAGRSSNSLSGEDLAEYLKMHGIKTEIVTRKGDGNVGEQLLAATKESGADLLLMGAYGKSRGRELIFGGVSQYVIEHAKIPVLLVH